MCGNSQQEMKGASVHKGHQRSSGAVVLCLAYRPHVGDCDIALATRQTALNVIDGLMAMCYMYV